MKNTFIGLLLFLIVMVLLSLALNKDSYIKTEDRYDAYVSYDTITSCNQYIDFMECAIDRIDDVAIQRIYKNNIYTTVRNRASLKDETLLEETCDESLQGLGDQLALHGYGCEIVSEDPAIRNLVLPEAQKIILEEEVPAVLSGDTAEVLTGDIEPQVITGSLDEYINNDVIAPYTRVQVLQNRVGFLRIRERPTTSSLEIGRLGIGDIVDTLDEQQGRYQVRYGQNGTNEGWISMKYARNIGLAIQE